MKYIEITRTRQNKNGIVGILSIDNDPFCVTMERPWEDNKANVSCVPVGIYALKRITSPTFGDTFEIQDVPNDRKHCIFHWGNTIVDSRGCVLTGLKIGRLGDDLAILASKDAYNEFLAAMGDDIEAILVISSPMIS